MPTAQRSLSLLLYLALVLVLSGAPADAQPTDLVLCLDTSGSMDVPVAGATSTRWEIERDGSAAAVQDPAVIPHDGSIRITVLQFSDTAQVEVPPTVIASISDAQSVAASIHGIQPRFSTTNPADCIELAVDTLAQAASFPGRKVIDVSTDGLPNVPDTTAGAANAVAEAEAAILAGFDAVNALGIVLSPTGTAFLEDMVQPQPAGGDDGFVVSVGDVREYQQRLSEKIVRETRGSCAFVEGVDILCPADGGDEFTLTLTFTNRTEDVIHHLFVLEDPAHPLPPGFVLLDDHFDLSADPICSPVSDPAGCTQADASREIEAKVRGQAGESFQLLLTLHNEDLSECCSLVVPIELPPCDCAQLLGEEITCQLELQGRQIVPRWKYDFTLQNLTNQTVEHVLMTPITPSTLDFSRPFFLNLGLGPVSPAGGGITPSLSTQIGGAGAVEGREVCFHLSTHTDGFGTCCAIEHCVTLPSCRFEVGPVLYEPIGASLLRVREDALVVSGFGPSGEDGLGISFPPARESAIALQPPQPESDQYLLDLDTHGIVQGEEGQPVVGLRAFDSPSGTRMLPRTAVGAVSSVEIFNGGQSMGTFQLRQDQGITIPSRLGCDEIMVHLEESDIGIWVIWPQPITLVARSEGSEPVTGDRVVFHTALRAEVDGLTRLDVRARAIPELVVEGFDLEPVPAPPASLQAAPK